MHHAGLAVSLCECRSTVRGGLWTSLMARILLQHNITLEGTPASYFVWLQVFSGKRSTRTEEEVITNAALQQAWRRLQGDATAEPAEPAEASKPIEGDCAICYDEMHPDGGTLQVPES